MSDHHDLQPCPFCGGPADLIHDEDTCAPTCTACGFVLEIGPYGIGWYGSASDAAAAWNRRAPPGGAKFDPFEPHWPEGLNHGDVFKLPCDDKGRNGRAWLQVIIANDGDVHLVMQSWEEFPEGAPDPIPTIRSRNYFGGGRNHRSHQALLWLAQAIRLDSLPGTGAGQGAGL